MLDAPRQDWQSYESLIVDLERQQMRSETAEQRLAAYVALFNLITALRAGTRNAASASTLGWSEKQQVRRKLVNAFQSLDKVQRGRLD